MDKHEIRRKILETLANSEDEINKKHDLTGLNYELEIAIGVDTIRQEIGYTEYELESQLIYLTHSGEVNGFYEDPCMRYMITRVGRLALADEKHLKAADVDRKARNEEYRAVLGARLTLVSTIVTLTLAVVAMGINTCATAKNSIALEQINHKIDSLVHKK